MTNQPALLVVTGASGAGKTTLVRELESLRLPGVGCYQLDSMGVPSAEEMERRWGGGEGWQAYAIEHWVERLLRNDDGVEVAVLDGQTRPNVVRATFDRFGARIARIVLVDCDTDERNARLCGPRGQPELACGPMDCWAAYLRGQADALGLPIINTTGRPVGETVTELADLVRELAELLRAAT